MIKEKILHNNKAQVLDLYILESKDCKIHKEKIITLKKAVYEIIKKLK